MLDSDVASLFEYETKELNRNVKNNIARFPEEYCFQLSDDEYKNLRCKNSTSSSKNNYGGRRYNPFVFTEYGITMLAGILKSNKAVQISIEIVNTFIEMRKFLLSSANVLDRLTTAEYKILTHDKKIDEILVKVNEKNQVKEMLFYDGQIYDAYVLLLQILKKAKNEIIIIDNYLDRSILDILCEKDKNVSVIIITNNFKLSELDMDKFVSQYGEVKVNFSSDFHDRFIILDSKELYHVGASLKDLGKNVLVLQK